MAQAKAPSNTDRPILAAAHAYCAAHDELQRLCDIYDDLPDDLAGAIFDRMRVAKHRALRYQATSMTGVIAKAQMIKAGELFDVDTLIVSAITDLLAVYSASAACETRHCAEMERPRLAL